MSGFIRWLGGVVSALLIAILSPVGTEYVKALPAGDVIAALAAWPWLPPIAYLTIGFTAGVWLDWFMRRFDESRDRAKRAVGNRFQLLADRVRSRQQDDAAWPENITDMRMELLSAFLDAKKYGVWTPDGLLFDRGARDLIAYLNDVGTLQGNGHYKEARRVALGHQEGRPAARRAR